MLRLAKLLLIVIVWTTTSGFLPFWPDKTVRATTSKKVVACGETFTYSVTIKGYFSQPELVLPELVHAQIVSQSENKDYSLEKGRTKTTITVTITLFFRAPNTYRIPAAIVHDGKRRYRGNAIAIKVIGKPLQGKRRITPYLVEGTPL